MRETTWSAFPVRQVVGDGYDQLDKKSSCSRVGEKRRFLCRGGTSSGPSGERPVAGVMVYAKTKKAAEDLSRQFSAHTTEKYYLALLTGKMAQEQGKLENFLQKDGRTNTSSVVASGGKRACLEYRILGEKDGLSLAEIHLNTGRHHQIRVQTAYAGAGIYGDMKYNSDQTDMWKKEHGVQREKTELCLFAWRLVFEHPSLHKRMIFKVLPKTGRMCIDEWPCLSYYE